MEKEKKGGKACEVDGDRKSNEEGKGQLHLLLNQQKRQPTGLAKQTG